ncbi:MAG: hypothetical protein ChlgKO_00170 [Chlamydiales bacterium]
MQPVLKYNPDKEYFDQLPVSLQSDKKAESLLDGLKINTKSIIPVDYKFCSEPLSGKVSYTKVTFEVPEIKKIELQEVEKLSFVRIDSEPPIEGFNDIAMVAQSKDTNVAGCSAGEYSSPTRIFGIIVVIATVITYLAKTVLINKLSIRENTVFKITNVGLNVILAGIGFIGAYAAVAPVSFESRL